MIKFVFARNVVSGRGPAGISLVLKVGECIGIDGASVDDFVGEFGMFFRSSRRWSPGSNAGTSCKSLPDPDEPTAGAMPPASTWSTADLGMA